MMYFLSKALNSYTTKSTEGKGVVPIYLDFLVKEDDRAGAELKSAAQGYLLHVAVVKSRKPTV